MKTQLALIPKLNLEFDELQLFDVNHKKQMEQILDLKKKVIFTTKMEPKYFSSEFII